MQEIKVNICDRNEHGYPVFPTDESHMVPLIHVEVKHRFASAAGEPEGKKVDAVFVLSQSDVEDMQLLETKNAVVFEYSDKKYMIIKSIYFKSCYGNDGKYDFECYSLPQ